VTVNQVMCHTGMVRFFAENFLQYGACLTTVGKSCIVICLRSEQGKRVEGCCFAVVRVMLIGLFHSGRVRAGPDFVVVPTPIKTLGSRDVVALTIGLRVE